MANKIVRLFEFGDFRLDPARGGLYRDGAHIPLTPKALALLLFLVENRDRVLTKEELLKAVWPDTFVEEGNLAFTIHHVRKALGEKNGSARFVETLPRQGYRFVAPVREVEDALPEAATEPPPRPQRPRWLAWAMLAGLAVFGAGGLRIARRSPANREANFAWMAPVDAEFDAGPALVRLTYNVAEDRQPDVSPDGRQIVFVSNREGGKDEIYVMDTDGSNPHNITHHPDNDSPAWSPDGRRIAFQSKRDGAMAIYTMNADGSQIARLAAGVRAAWSPGGKRIAYTCVLNGHNEICVINASGGEPQSLTHDGDFNSDAAWSPDGAWIAFTSAQNKHLQVHAMRADGSARRVLAAGAGRNRLPVWSPDGRLVAFNSSRLGQPDSIYVMESDGTLPRRVTDGKFEADEAAWLPNGRGLVFESLRDGNSEIYRMRLPSDPDGAVRLTNNVAADRHPSWSPDGKWIVFDSNRNGQPDLYVMDVEGGNIHTLTRSSVANEWPAWSPDGTKIAFSSNRDGRRGIFIMNPDGSGVARITEGTNDSLPSWSGDGRALCFIRESEVWLAPVAGGQVRKVVNGQSCAVSMNGKQILFDMPANGVRELQRLDLESGAAVNFTHNGRSNGTPAWSRDGLRIAFNSNADGYGFGIFVTDAGTASSAPKRLTAREGFDAWPAWSPDGHWIVFQSRRDGNDEIYKTAVP
jgi:Tol biopolymer transport system component/DNA-binding winged helix-turn-helix (wHTH) protein